MNGELIANDHHELHDAEQEDEEQWKAQGQFDGSLATVTVAVRCGARDSQLAGDRIDDPIEEVADLAGPAAAGCPADDEQSDDRGAEHDEGVFGGRLTAIVSGETPAHTAVQTV